MKLLISLISFFALCTNLFSQDINGKLGSNGQFLIRDTTATFLSLSQSTGNLTLNRNLVLPVMTIGSQVGAMFRGSERLMHNYQAVSTVGFNTFIGLSSGNFTMVTGGAGYHASYNTGVGYQSLSLLSTGYENQAFGYQSLYSTTTGHHNSALGYMTLYSNTTGNFNTAL